MAKFSMRVVVLFAVALLAPRPGAATELGDVASQLKAFQGVDHFAADPGGSYKGVADPKLHAKLNRVVGWAASSLAAGIRSGKPAPELLYRLTDPIRLVKRTDLEDEDAERFVKVYEQLFVLAQLTGHDIALNNWMFGIETRSGDPKDKDRKDIDPSDIGSTYIDPSH